MPRRRRVLLRVIKMEQLDQYISSLFARMPDTANRIELEDQVRLEAAERYDALLAKGHNEAEALGLVIPHISEQKIRRHLDSGAKSESETGAGTGRGHGYEPQRSEEESAEIEQMVAAYNHFRPRFGVAMAIGVLLIIVGIVLAVWLGFSYNNPLYAIIGFFIPVAVAVFIFIYFGIKHASFVSYFRAKEVYEYLNPEMVKRLRRQKMRYREYADERRFREFD